MLNMASDLRKRTKPQVRAWASVLHVSRNGDRKRKPNLLAPGLATVLESVTTESKGKGYGHESLRRAAKCAVNDNIMPPSATTRVGLVAKPIATNFVLKATRKGKHIKNGIPQYDGARCTVTR